MKDSSRTILSAGDDDATVAFLFVSRSDTFTYAVCRDPHCAKLLSDGTESGWTRQAKFALGVREAMPIPVAPEPVLRGLEANGYYIWRDGSNPKGTSQ